MFGSRHFLQVENIVRHTLLTEIWYPEIGGSVQLFDELYRRHCPDTEVVSLVAGSREGDREFDASYPLPTRRFLTERFQFLRPESAVMYSDMVYETIRECIRSKVDVLHCARVIPEGLVGLCVSRLLRIPFVVWVHGEEVAIYRNYSVKRRLMPMVFRNARAVLCNSTTTMTSALDSGAPGTATHLIHPGIDGTQFQGPFDCQDIIARWGLTDKKVLLTVGRLAQRKGHDVVLKALALLRDPDIVYLVLSSGEMEAELKALAEQLGIRNSVRFVGAVDRRELPRYYSVADLFVMANRTLPNNDLEGFGMVFLEASASGKAVIGGRSGGVVDTILHGETGLLVDASSETIVAESIAELMSAPERRERLGRRGREWVSRFSWPAASTRLFQIACGS